MTDKRSMLPLVASETLRSNFQQERDKPDRSVREIVAAIFASDTDVVEEAVKLYDGGEKECKDTQRSRRTEFALKLRGHEFAGDELNSKKRSTDQIMQGVDKWVRSHTDDNIIVYRGRARAALSFQPGTTTSESS